MRIFSFQAMLGLIVLIVGVLLLLNNLNILDYEVTNIFDYWPVIPLIIGINMLLTTFRPVGSTEGQRTFFSWGQFISAIILIGIGVLFLGSNLDFIDERYTELIRDQFWPILISVLLILLGLNLLRSIGTANKGGNRVAFMGGIEMGNKPWRLESGSYLAFMGGIDLDLTTAEIPEGVTVLDFTAVMGGIDVKAPSDINLVCDGAAFLGGISVMGHEDGGIITSRRIEHSGGENAGGKTIHIQGRAVMGGIEISEKLKKEK